MGGGYKGNFCEEYNNNLHQLLVSIEKVVQWHCESERRLFCFRKAFISKVIYDSFLLYNNY